ncbi:MAG: diguanylate cyclase [Lachnospiraceae bacterium]
MNYKLVILPVVALFIAISLYWYWVFELIDHLLKNPVLTKRWRLPVGILNALVVFGISTLIGGTMILYILIIAMLFVEFRIFYKDTILKNLFCTSACVVHVLAIRAISTGIFSLVHDIPIYKIYNDPILYAYSVLTTFIFLNIAVGLTINFLPLDRIRIVNEHHDQQVCLTVWMIVDSMYLLFNSYIAESPVYHIGVIVNQIVAPCVVVIGIYIMLLFAVKTGKLLGYKEKNVELKLTVSKEREYRNSITKDAILTYEFNLSQDMIISGFEGIKVEGGNGICHYTNMLGYMAHKVVYPEDIEEFARCVSPSNITKEFEQGKSELTVEYRRRVSEDEYIWCRAITNLARDAKNDDILGFTYIKNIDVEKRNQLELQYKAERDSLTGLYNKGITEKLIAEHLLFNHSSTVVAFFIIDIDDFKDINDHLGHAYGDKVLRELGEKVLTIFRSEDIVGRIGGDEYIAYMKNGATDAVVREKGEEICKTLYTTYQDGEGQEIVLSSSVGVAVSPKDGITFEELYNHADTALYVAKKAGKNNCQIYDGRSFSGYQSTRN